MVQFFHPQFILSTVSFYSRFILSDKCWNSYSTFDLFFYFIHHASGTFYHSTNDSSSIFGYSIYYHPLFTFWTPFTSHFHESFGKRCFRTIGIDVLIPVQMRIWALLILFLICLRLYIFQSGILFYSKSFISFDRCLDGTLCNDLSIHLRPTLSIDPVLSLRTCFLLWTFL